MIKYVQLFGERCSGTNFAASLIQRNLARVELTDDFGGKHWFIKDHYPRGRPNRSTDFQCVRPLGDSDDTLFLVLFRNPFDWLRSINASPYHAENHWGLTLSGFLRKPWHAFETYRVNHRWPDNEEKYWFIEEADNILRLRTKKIEHLLLLQERVKQVAFMNYETIRDDADILRSLAHRFRIGLKHPEIKAEPRHFGKVDSVEFVPTRYPGIASEDLEFIRSELDWELEGRIGYTSGGYRE